MSRRKRTTLSPNLFPFLAVLVCTLGTLILLLALVAQAAQNSAEEMADSHAEATRLAAQEQQWQAEKLIAYREQQTAALEQKRSELGHLEDHLRRLREQLSQLETEAQAANEPSDEQSNLQADQRLAELRSRIESEKEKIRQLREERSHQPPRVVIIPYRGGSGTDRRPVYVECTDVAVILQPEGVRITAAQLAGLLGPGNPLDAALRAVRSHWKELDPDSPPPYPLLLVRPGGIHAYAACRSAMTAWDDQFGYELIPADLQLAFPKPDPSLATKLVQTIDEAVARQHARIAGRPGRRAGGGLSHGGLAGGTGGGRTGEGEDFGQGSGQGNGLGSAQGAGLGDGLGDGLGAGPVDGDFRDAGLASGEQGAGAIGKADAPGSSLAGSSDASGELPGSGTGSAPSGEGLALRGPRLSGPAGADRPAPAAGGEATGGNGGDSAADSGAAVNGESGSSGSDAGNPLGGSGGSLASGQMTAGGGTASSAAASSPGAAGISNMAASQCAGSMGDTAPAPDPHAKTFSELAETPPTSAGRRPKTIAEGSSAKPLLHAGNNWAMPETNLNRRGATIVRQMSLRCEANGFVLVSEAKSDIPSRAFPIRDGMVEQAVLELAAAVRDRVESWGPAMQNGRWDPVLRVHVGAGAESRFDQLEILLRNSGIRLERVTAR